MTRPTLVTERDRFKNNQISDINTDIISMKIITNNFIHFTDKRLNPITFNEIQYKNIDIDISTLLASSLQIEEKIYYIYLVFKNVINILKIQIKNSNQIIDYYEAVHTGITDIKNVYINVNKDIYVLTSNYLYEFKFELDKFSTCFKLDWYYRNLYCGIIENQTLKSYNIFYLNQDKRIIFITSLNLLNGEKRPRKTNYKLALLINANIDQIEEIIDNKFNSEAFDKIIRYCDEHKSEL